LDVWAHKLHAQGFSEETLIADLRFKCINCRSNDVAWVIPLTDVEAHRFAAGGKLTTRLMSTPPPFNCSLSEDMP
jgi:hypothetical protein